MPLNRSFLLLVASIVFFAIGLVLALDWVTGGNETAMLFAGLLAFAASHVP